MKNKRVSVAGLLLACLIAAASAATNAAGNAESVQSGGMELSPGKTLSFTFPDMPPTLHAAWSGDAAPAAMTITLPKDYHATNRHPVILFLYGGDGGDARKTWMLQKVTEGRRFVCVSLPLFKVRVARTGNMGTDLFLSNEDFTHMWPLLRRMFDRLRQAVPNLDPGFWFIGGFSNGAHTIAGLLGAASEEMLRLFRAFILIEGGNRLDTDALLAKRELARGKQWLILIGDRHPPAMQGPFEAELKTLTGRLRAIPMPVEVHVMQGVGHSFPEAEQAFVGEWLRKAVP